MISGLNDYPKKICYKLVYCAPKEGNLYYNDNYVGVL